AAPSRRPRRAARATARARAARPPPSSRGSRALAHGHLTEDGVDGLRQRLTLLHGDLASLVRRRVGDVLVAGEERERLAGDVGRASEVPLAALHEAADGPREAHPDFRPVLLHALTGAAVRIADLDPHRAELRVEAEPRLDARAGWALELDRAGGVDDLVGVHRAVAQHLHGLPDQVIEAGDARGRRAVVDQRRVHAERLVVAVQVVGVLDVPLLHAVDRPLD